MICARCHRQFSEPDARVCPFDGERLQDVPEIELVNVGPARPAIYANDWLVCGLLGRGGMGRVYLGQHSSTRQLAAIKVLENPSSKLATERFFREVATAEQLQHPAIVRVYEHGKRLDGTPYVITEYLFGESLGDRLRRPEPLEPKEALWIASQVASALRAAHGAGVVHRDVKPDNIYLVGERGLPHSVKLLDFGLARLVGQTGLTAAGVTVGTLLYMAPEQAVNDRTGPRTDIYGLGVVLYRMLTHTLPFEGDDVRVLAQHLIVSPEPPSVRREGLAPGLDDLVLTAMRKRPTNRFPTMEDFEDAINRVLRGDRWTSEDPIEEDYYQPHTPFARNIASVFHKKLGRTPPWES